MIRNHIISACIIFDSPVDLPALYRGALAYLIARIDSAWFWSLTAASI
jgi:hypothetical protein